MIHNRGFSYCIKVVGRTNSNAANHLMVKVNVNIELSARMTFARSNNRLSTFKQSIVFARIAKRLHRRFRENESPKAIIILRKIIYRSAHEIAGFYHELVRFTTQTLDFISNFNISSECIHSDFHWNKVLPTVKRQTSASALVVTQRRLAKN